MNYTLQKNLGFLLRALVRARAEGLPVRVVVTSRLDRGPRSCYAEDRQLMDGHGLVESGYLIPAGPKRGDELAELYRAADACIFPSTCESFGHPQLEALVMNKPLICADRAFAREISGTHALYVNPVDPEELVRLWRDWPTPCLLLQPPDMARLNERFSWRSHVERLTACILGEDVSSSTDGRLALKEKASAYGGEEAADEL
jgi:glycosyltransferase involved in cell wall biosynthesis